MSIPKDKKSDHLFLLMGENPLPNYVAAMLLTRTDSSTIYLLHSEGEQRQGKTGEKTVLSTKQFAEFLQAVIKAEKPLVKVVLHGISEVDSKEIENKVREIVQHHKVMGRVGFNYTGARKPMAIHTYKVLAERFDDAVFSYLDANRLEMRFDGISTPYPVAHELQVKLKTLAALHAYEIKEIKQTPKFPDLTHALADVHASNDGFDQWRAWLRCRPLTFLPNAPILEPVINTLDILCGGKATPNLVAEAFGFDQLDSCYTWLLSGWLEELALEAIRKNKSPNQVKIHDYGISIKPIPHKSLKLDNPKNFELDAATMIGYQLFAVSCIASKKEGGETKKHLFEAYVRARQLGGDEARVALVCLAENPSVLQDEIGRDWHPSHQIRVFGRDDLMNLTDAFYDWFTTAN